MRPIDIICMGCAFTASVNKVTAGLRCTCGSTDLDAFTGTVEQMAHIARLRGPAPVADTFVRHMTGAAPKNVEPNWDEYVGPPPGPNQMSNGVGRVRCPNCNGGKFDIQEGGICRACVGQGFITPTTSVAPKPFVAPHNYPSTQTKTPFMAGRPSGDPMGSPEDHIRASTPGWGTHAPAEPFSWNNEASHYPKAHDVSPATKIRQDHDYTGAPAGPFEMHGTSCPGCGTGPMTLQKDHLEDAWASCPNCGPLANVDRNPEIDPYNMPSGFQPDKGYKAASLLGSRKTGRLLAKLASIESTNPGLSRAQAVWVARKSLRKYPESK